jgi:hypothetical protein
MAAHLFKEENEVIQVRESLDGGQDRQAVEASLVEMQLYTRMTRGNTGIFSVAISPREGDTLTPEQQARAIELIEKKFKLEGQPRIRVDHEKSGRFHSHLFFSIVDQEKCKLIEISHYKYKLQECAVTMEKEFDLAPVRRTPDEHTIEVTNADRMRDTKERKCQDRKREVSDLWNRSKSAEEFLEQIRAAGYEVAKGERSRFVLLDRDGQPYNLVRELPKEVKAKAVTMRFEGLENGFLSVEEAKKQLLERQQYDREQAGIDRTNRELEAADEAGKKKAAQEQESKLKEKRIAEKTVQERFREHGRQSGVDRLRENIKEREKEKDPVELAMAQSKKWFDIIDRDREDSVKIAALENKLHQDHKFEDLENRTKELKKDLAKSDTFWGRKTGRYQELLDKLKDHETYFEERKQSIQSQVDRLKRELIESRPPELHPANDDKEKPKPEKEQSSNVSDFEKAAKQKASERQAKEEAFKERMRRKQEQKEQERDKEQGMDFDIS